MPNMSYCRFQNTSGDLQDCFDYLTDDRFENYKEAFMALSADEKRAFVSLLGIMEEMTNQFGDDYNFFDENRHKVAVEADLDDYDPNDVF